MTPMHKFVFGVLPACAAMTFVMATGAVAQVDPGPRPLPAAAGGPLAGLSANLSAYFTAAQPFFNQLVSVSGTIAGAPGVGLGPRFNLDSCVGCHAYPAAGGSSPPSNPEVLVATANGATNTIPSFITAAGPVRVARFVLTAAGTPDGNVYDLFTVTHRSDATGCAVAQPNFAAQLAAGNVIFRIPTPTFGDGLVESTPDANLIAAQTAHAAEQAQFGIGARFNHDPEDGTITRFGWKAQQKSLLAFAGEAELVEEGVTTDARPNKRDNVTGCQFNALPEDAQPLTPRANDSSAASALSAAMVNQAAFMRMTAAPARGSASATVAAGQALFAQVGCDGCHFQTQTTTATAITGGKAVTYMPWSDFALHNMGAGLVDGITQGEAVGGDWRTAPLWGLGQRLFFLHDGRASDLGTAIAAHASADSEANKSVAAYNALTTAQKQSLLTFLRSL